MSCIMSGHDTIDRVIDAIIYGAKRGCPTPMTLLMPAAGVGLRLFKMNAVAHNSCYEGRHADAREIPATYKHTPRCQDDFQLFKSLQFYLYQCSEGGVPESTLFKELDAIKDWYAARVGYQAEADTWSAAKNGTRQPWATPAAAAAYNAADWA